MASALINFYQQKQTDLIAYQEMLQLSFSDLSEDLTTLQHELEALVDGNTTLGAEITALRESMSNPNLMPADIELLAQQLRELLIERRHNGATILDAQKSLSEMTAQQTIVNQQLDNTTKAITATEADLAAAELAGIQHQLWVAPETNDLIAELKIEAQALLDIDSGIGTVDPENNTALMSDALNRVNSDIPELLRTRARARRSLVSAAVEQHQVLLAALQQHQNNHGETTTGDAGLLLSRQTQYQFAESALKGHALSLGDELNRALSLIAAINNSAELSAAENDRIGATTLDETSDAITTEVALIDAQAAVAAKQLDLHLAITQSLVNDITADPFNDVTVQSEQNLLMTLETDLTAAELAHSDLLAAELDLWEASVPEPIWSNLHHYDLALAALERIVASDGVALSNAFDSAENNLVQALVEIGQRQNLTDKLAGDHQLAAAKLSYQQGSLSERQLSATKGDF